MKAQLNMKKTLVSWISGRDNSPMIHILRELLEARQYGIKGTEIPADAVVVYSSTRYTIRRDADGYHYLSELLPVKNHPKPDEDVENRAYCKRIADELDSYAARDARRCPHCGEIHIRDWYEVGDNFRCPVCGETSWANNWEEMSVYDYLSDTLDVTWIIDSRREYENSRWYVTLGGPTVWIDTESDCVQLRWGGKSACYGLSYDTSVAVNNAAEEMWEV